MPNGTDLAMVRELMARLGVTADDLADDDAAPNVPTVREYLARVRDTARPGVARTYGSYWSRLADDELGARPLCDVRTSDLAAWVERVGAAALTRRNAHGGAGARENAVAAARYAFRLAVNDGLLATNPALAVSKPRRRRTARRALTDPEVQQLAAFTVSGGDDPALDLLLLRFHLETGARRGGALNLPPMDLDRRRQCVLLREKFGTETWQPVSRTLLVALADHAAERGATDPAGALLRYRDGTPLTRRRYNTLTERWRTLEWVAREGVSPHWLRHTAITAVERIAGHAVATAFARHTVETGTTTSGYTKASIEEVAAAVAVLSGEAHPLAPEA